MRTNRTLTLCAALALAAPSGASFAQTPPGQIGSAQPDAQAESRPPAPTSSVSPAPKPSMEQLGTKSVVPLPSTGGAGVKPPTQPGQANPAPPDNGSGK